MYGVCLTNKVMIGFCVVTLALILIPERVLGQHLIPDRHTADIAAHVENGRWSARDLGANRRKVLYIFHSFNCPYSAAFVSQEADSLEREGVELRWFAWPEPGQDIDTLAYLAYTRDMSLFMRALAGERINAPDARGSNAIVAAFNQNRTSVLFIENLSEQLTRRTGTPTFAYQDDDGQWRLSVGYGQEGFNSVRSHLSR